MAPRAHRGRRVIGAVGVIGLICVIGLAALACVIHPVQRDRSKPADAFPLTVLYVYDGDTIQAQPHTSNDIVTSSSPIRIRLIGVDTPELERDGVLEPDGMPVPECWAVEARQHLIELLPEGATVWAEPDRETWDHYGRTLLHLWTDDGRLVSGELVAAGDAGAIRIPPNLAYAEVLTAIQADARAAGRGRWGACP